MPRSAFSRKAHTNSRIIIFCTQCVFSSTLTSNRRQFHVKIEVHIESNFHFSVSIDVFNHFNATNIKNKIILGL